MSEDQYKEDQYKKDPSNAASKLFGGIIKEGKSLADEVADNAKAVARYLLLMVLILQQD